MDGQRGSARAVGCAVTPRVTLFSCAKKKNVRVETARHQKSGVGFPRCAYSAFRTVFHVTIWIFYRTGSSRGPILERGRCAFRRAPSPSHCREGCGLRQSRERAESFGREGEHVTTPEGQRKSPDNSQDARSHGTRRRCASSSSERARTGTPGHCGENLALDLALTAQFPSNNRSTGRSPGRGGRGGPGGRGA